MTKNVPEAAIREWKDLIGESFVRADEAALESYGQCTIPAVHRPLAVLMPANVEEIQKILKVAETHRIPLYPISKGKNWGYGSAAPASENNVVLDLSRMNRILEVNEKLAYAVVEPGVTQGQLYEYLQQNHIPLLLDATGAHPDASLIGNILERGYGQTPYSDHFLNSCGMEVVLADGRILKTGYGHFADAKARYLHKWGLGPYLEGLFTQSNFGIVTKTALWLMPKPDYFGLFHFKISNDQVLCEVIERMRILKLNGVLRSAVKLFNDLRVISSVQQYPWQETGGETPLSDEIRAKLMKKHDVGAWNCVGGLGGSPREVKALFRNVKRVLKGIARPRFVPEYQLNLAKRFPNLIKSVIGVDVSLKLPFIGLMRGIPSEKPSILPYWRKKKPAPQSNLDPVRDQCGLIWCSPMIPMTGEDGSAMIRLVRSICAQYEFEFNVALILTSERTLDATVAIIYDRENPGETEKAVACHQALLDQLIKAGYIPYRLDTHSMKSLVSDNPFWQVCSDIKKILDPHGLIAPGRYSHPSK